ncbi:SOS response-associated peptidase [Candidatus Protochlamydia sp. R18]|uniref:SOS response-associated peptidase n=1 Tax=Candidatus Protochlamydia sp. R18 TaxID=1353977 RepID=UPI0005AAD9BC|nr:SOS response-associated peptidase [Candidatus Protochlamydia sp. R18]
MCGRFTLTAEAINLSERFEIPLKKFTWFPRFNIAPSQSCLTIFIENQQKQIESMVWGLIPPWSKEKRPNYQMINVRSETLKSKPSFQNLFKTRRCLIPADGFFEWKATSSGKIPFRITLKNGDLFAFAGIWDIWKDKNGEEIKSFAILTTASNSVVNPIHNRMPVILQKTDEAMWLNSSNQNALEQILKPYPSNEIISYEVSNIVNFWKNDYPICIQPI